MGELSNEPISDFHVPQTEGLQIDDHRLNTSCAVIERPDHHCGDDLVDDIWVTPGNNFRLTNFVMLATNSF